MHSHLQRHISVTKRSCVSLLVYMRRTVSLPCRIQRG
uniref:Uncharacterized protein n=1 Tax=Siphoviridae sp. ctnPP24 TaxID=2825662 RepID=A0A8S5TZ76_9CAUD|nr:MAG TPA: hypothetical protein [Siphoviridae sp. ctnPP24]